MNKRDRKLLRQLDYEDRKANDPWFGKRRSTTMQPHKKPRRGKHPRPPQEED